MTSPPARPKIPERSEYGPREPDKQLSWATVERWLQEAKYYWIATTRSDGTPHTVPVWAVWVENELAFSTSPETLTARNLAVRPTAVVHPESAAETVIVRGPVTTPEPRSLSLLVDAYEAKYGWRLDPDDSGMPFYVLTPSRVLAWQADDVRGTSARWDF